MKKILNKSSYFTNGRPLVLVMSRLVKLGKQINAVNCYKDLRLY